MKLQNIKKISAYVFAALSVLVTLRILYVSITDFFDNNALAFQMLTLSYNQILFEDTIIIIIHLGLLVLLVRFLSQKNIKGIFIASLSIWIFTFLQFYFESFFRYSV
ncbi:MAG: hypothetical protein JWQ30_385 [Sediminibacterium sp.]|nr:hypothetical protein [Sediminibacterium sp.]